MRQGDIDLDGRTVFMTGLTGTVGSFLAREALRRGARVIALVRGNDAHEAKLRAEGALTIVDAQYDPPQLEVIHGDVCRRDLGMTGQVMLDGVDLLLHCAAAIDFDSALASRIRRTNVDGTRHVLAFAAGLGCPLLHVSTAYVAGQRDNVVREDEIDVGQTFSNVYEETKCEAERLVRDWSERTGLPATVLRPSIVLGDYAEGRIIHFNTAYDVMHAFELICRRIGEGDVRVAAMPEVHKNFIPADYFAEAAWAVLASGRPGTYHVTNPNPLKMSELRDIYMQLFGVGNITIVDEHEFMARPRTRAESILRNALAAYEPYLASEPVFDRSGADSVLNGARIELPRLDVAYFQRLLDYARSANWGGPRRKADTAHTPDIVEAYFAEFLPGKLYQQLLPDLRKLTASFSIRVHDTDQPAWSLQVLKGALTSIEADGDRGDCCFLVGVDTFARIVSGRTRPQEAFFKRQVEIEGDMETGLKLATVLGSFFREFPYDPGAGP